MNSLEWRLKRVMRRLPVSESTQMTATDSVMKLDDADVALFRDSVRASSRKRLSHTMMIGNGQESGPVIFGVPWAKTGSYVLICPRTAVVWEHRLTSPAWLLRRFRKQWVWRVVFGDLCSLDIVAPYILHMGTAEQKHYWIARLATGDAVGAIGMTEPGTGSDLQNIKTNAVRDGDDYVINGQKTFITNGQHCDLLILATKTDPKQRAKGVTLFTVDTSLPGFERVVISIKWDFIPVTPQSSFSMICVSRQMPSWEGWGKGLPR